MKIKIMSREAAEKYSRQERTENVGMISISDIGDELPSILLGIHNGIEHFISMQFDDVPAKDVGCMTPLQASKLAEFVIKTEKIVDEFVIHCEAGVSRSPAIAAAVLKYTEQDDIEIFKKDYYFPNMSCYKLMLEALGCVVLEDELIQRRNLSLVRWQ